MKRLKHILFGNPLNPLNPRIRQHISLVALLAWVGLGADALSSSCYGPEQAYLALGNYHHLALYIAGITVLTIFIIVMGYNQVIELFPQGGGGYTVATKLLHPYAGLVSGAALIIDYILTITVSIASGTDALFSFLPTYVLPYKLWLEALILLALLVMNLRGMKEAILVLLPIFVGFIVMHVGLIVYGIILHANNLILVLPSTLQDTQQLATNVGWIGVLALILHAYSLGSGTYTGLEAVSNNMNHLSEPKVATGKRTMWYMAISLSVTAGGIILLYLVWQATPKMGETLNASVFKLILGDSLLGQTILITTLLLEAGLLFVAANTGFAAGPTVLASMAIDKWVPKRFRYLSDRLVIQNGLILYGVAAFVMLLWTSGDVSLLVVLYSINVFITFSLSLLSICIYWIRHRHLKKWLIHFMVAALACFITTSILIITIIFKFIDGGWLTLLLTTTLILIFLYIKHHYLRVEQILKNMEHDSYQPLSDIPTPIMAIDPQLQTAVIFVNSSSNAMHTLLSVIRLFPTLYKNFIFISAGTVDVESFKGQEELAVMQKKVDDRINHFVNYCHQLQIPAEGYTAYGTDTMEELKKLTDLVSERYPRAIFFASEQIFKHENLITRILHTQTPLLLQNYLHSKGRELMILPMLIE